MKSSFELLQEIGPQEIYERTHISRTTIEAIIAKKFEIISRVQFNGFVAIIEREFDIDLRELKIEYNFSHEIQIEEVEQEIAPLIKQPSHLKKYLLFASIFIAITTFFLLKDSSLSNENALEINNSTIEKAKEQIKIERTSLMMVEVNETSLVSSSVNISSEAKNELTKEVKSLIVKPKTNLWIGIIDTTTHKKKQYITRENIELNASKRYLFTLGHGYVVFDIDDESFDYKEKNKIRFLYENGVITKISREEFQNYNQGKNW